MNYEDKLAINQNGTLVIKGTEISVIEILRMLSEGNSVNDVIKVHQKISVADIGSCFEYATELVIINDYKKATTAIREDIKERYALAARIRALKDKPFIFTDHNGNKIDVSSK